MKKWIKAVWCRVAHRKHRLPSRKDGHHCSLCTARGILKVDPGFLRVIEDQIRRWN